MMTMTFTTKNCNKSKKKIHSILILLSVLLSLFSYQNIEAQNIGDNLVAYWSFENNLEDNIGVSDGTMTGTEAYSAGQFGQAIDLDGSSYVDAGNDASIKLLNQDFSISAWFKVDLWDKQWQTLLSKGDNRNYRISRISSNANNITFAAGNQRADGSTNVNDGSFHHVVGVFKNNVDLTIYIDGVLQETELFNQTITDQFNLLIGENPQATGRQWNGQIDDVAIWGRAITEDEINQIYSSGMSLDELLNPAPIPTLSEWGIVILSIIMMIIGIAAVRQRKFTLG